MNHLSQITHINPDEYLQNIQILAIDLRVEQILIYKLYLKYCPVENEFF